MGKKTFDFSFNVPVDSCFDVLRAIVVAKNWRILEENQFSHHIAYRPELGNTVTANLRPVSLNKTAVNFEVNRPGQVLDPFNLYEKTLNKLLDPFTVEILVLENAIENAIDEGIICPSCGKLLAANTRFCPNDGTQIGKNCMKCNEHNSPSSKFCSKCGDLF